MKRKRKIQKWESSNLEFSFFASENKKCNISFRENANQNLKMLPNIIYLLLDVQYYFIEKYVKSILSKNVNLSLNNDNFNLIKSNQCDEWVDYLDNKWKRIYIYIYTHTKKQILYFYFIFWKKVDY